MFAEVVATFGLLLLIFALVRSGRAASAAAAVGAYIGAAYWFTSSTSFANPAITVGRIFSDTFAGIAPASVPAFVIAQLIGGLIAYAAVRTLYPDVGPTIAADVVVPHDSAAAEAASAPQPRVAQRAGDCRFRRQPPAQDRLTKASCRGKRGAARDAARPAGR